MYIIYGFVRKKKGSDTVCPLQICSTDQRRYLTVKRPMTNRYNPLWLQLTTCSNFNLCEWSTCTMKMNLFDTYDDNVSQHTISNLIVTVGLCLPGRQIKKADS